MRTITRRFLLDTMSLPDHGAPHKRPGIHRRVEHDREPCVIIASDSDGHYRYPWPERGCTRAFSVGGVDPGPLRPCAITAACACALFPLTCAPGRSGCLGVHLVRGVGASHASTRLMRCLRPPCWGCCDGGPSPGARETVAVVIEVTAAGVWAAGVVDLSPLGATPVG
jgi:hypothetical protein